MLGQKISSLEKIIGAMGNMSADDKKELKEIVVKLVLSGKGTTASRVSVFFSRKKEED